MIKKHPNNTKHLMKYKIIAITAGLVVFFALTGITMLLLSVGIDEFTISTIHLIEITALIAACEVLSIILFHYHSELTKLRQNASTDKLTELYNRSYLDPFLEKQIEIAGKTKKPVSIIMVDLDHFKEINDNNGHPAGDHVLTIFAQIVLKCIRKTDIIARYGGDEFIVVLPDTDTETARSVAERIRHDVSSAYISPVDGAIISSISCSVGISTYPVHCDSKHSLIKTSDLALYEAKHSGRNRTIVYSAENMAN